MTTPINCIVDPCPLLHVYLAHMRKASTCMFENVGCILYENNKHRLDECRTHSLEQKHVKTPPTISLPAGDEFVIAQSSMIGVGGTGEFAKIPVIPMETSPKPTQSKLAIKLPESQPYTPITAIPRPYSPSSTISPRMPSPSYFTDPLAGKCHYFYQGDFSITHGGKNYPIHICGNPVRNPQHYYCEACFAEIKKR